MNDGAYLPLWCLWRERNSSCFEDLERSSKDILSSCFHTLYIYIVAFVSPLLICYDDFLVCFSLSSWVIPFVYFLCTFGVPYAFNKIGYY